MIVGLGVVLEHLARAAGRADVGTAPPSLRRQDLARASGPTAGSRTVVVGGRRRPSVVVVGRRRSSSARVAGDRRRGRRRRSAVGRRCVVSARGVAVGGRRAVRRSLRRSRPRSLGAPACVAAASAPVAGVVDRPVVAATDRASWSWLVSVVVGGRLHCSTGRRYTWPVTWTRSSASCWSFTPGRLTTIASPWRRISGSATPRLSTRSRMLLDGEVEAGRVVVADRAARVTEIPPWRSSPSAGSVARGEMQRPVRRTRRRRCRSARAAACGAWTSATSMSPSTASSVASSSIFVAAARHRARRRRRRVGGVDLALDRRRGRRGSGRCRRSPARRCRRRSR